MKDIAFKNLTFCDVYFNNEQVDFFADRLCRLLGKNREKMSDFELFAFISSNIALCSASNFKHGFINSLSMVLGEKLDDDIVVLLQNRELQKQIWRKLYYKFDFFNDINKEKISVEKYKISEKSAEKTFKNICDEKYNFMPKILSLSEDYIIQTVHKSFGLNLSEFVENVLKFFDNSCQIEFAFNCEDFQIVRTDAFHAELVFQKILKGEKYNSSEISQILMWLLGSAILCRKTKIILCGSNSEKYARELNEYFAPLLAKHPDASLHIGVCIDGISELYKLLELISSEKNISPAVMLTEENKCDKYAELLAEIASVYPISCVEYCNMMLKSSKKKYIEYLFELLCAVCDSKYDALACVENILRKT